MADTDKTSKPSAVPESPTTAKEMDFEDEPLGGGGGGGPASSTPTQAEHAATNLPPHPATAAEAPPPKPPRPLSPRQQAENTLKEAFPTIDATVVNAVLTASGGQLEPAFNALLGMSDPDSQREAPPPPQPPRPTQNNPQGLSQVEADELYARQLAEHYSGAGNYGGPQRRNPPPPRQGQQRRLSDDEDDHSFFRDDLPVIQENIRRGFLETQSTVNKWVTNLKKKIDGEEDDDLPPQGGYTSGPQYRSRRSAEARRSADRERYDADPRVLGDDFSALELRDDEVPPPKPNRPLANPNLFKATPPPPPTDRRVSFQDGPPEEIGQSTGGSLYRASPPPARSGSGNPPPTPAATTTTAKGSKWQPLQNVDPSPVADNDPFSLGDSDDEKDVPKPATGKTDPTSKEQEEEDGGGGENKDDEQERLKKAAKEAMDDEIGGTEAKK